VDITLGKNDKCLDDYYSEAIGFEGQVRCMLIEPEDSGGDTLVIVTEELPKDEQPEPMKLLWRGDSAGTKKMFRMMKEDDEAEKRRQAKKANFIDGFGHPGRPVTVTIVVAAVASLEVEGDGLGTQWDPIAEAYQIDFQTHEVFQRWLDKCDEADEVVRLVPPSN
jgi:hypothetical protein